MQIQVKVNKKYNLSVEATADGHIEVTGCSADLAVNNLFLHPFSPRRGPPELHRLFPLKAKADEAFRALRLVDSDSTFIRALITYYNESFPKIVEELARPLQYQAHDIRERLERLQNNPREAARILRTVIAAIDSSDPSFFAVEKMLGTFEWLQSGDPRLLPCILAPESYGFGTDEFGYLTPQRDRCLIQIPLRTAYIPDDALPDPITTFEALCLGGCCDRSVLHANRAAAMLTMCADYGQKIESALHTLHAARRFELATQKLGAWSSLKNAAIITSSLATGALGVSGAATPLIGELGSTLLILAALTSGSGAYASWRRALSVAQLSAPSPSEIEKAYNFLNEQQPLIQSTLSLVLLRFLDGCGSACDYSSVIPSLDLFWREDFAGTPGLDLRIIPQTTRLSESGVRTTSYWRNPRELTLVDNNVTDSIDYDLRRRIHEELEPQYACLDHSAVADQHWNMLKAIQVSTSFARLAGLGEALSLPVFYYNVIRNAQSLTCDNSGRFQVIEAAFDKILKHYDLFQGDQQEQEVWGFCALPLLCIDQLQRSRAQRNAQKIALAALFAERL